MRCGIRCSLRSGFGHEEIHRAGMLGLNRQEARAVDGDMAKISNGTLEKGWKSNCSQAGHHNLESVRRHRAQ
jgi:hypothetical protein